MTNSTQGIEQAAIQYTGYTKSIMNFGYAILLITLFFSLSLGLAKLSLADTPQTHDVPMFHNDDGLGLLQDCRFMRAIALGEIQEIPTTVSVRSTNCLASIKSVVQVMYNVQKSTDTPTTCIPSIEHDWQEILEYVTAFMENQPAQTLSNKPYGVWIMLAVREKYYCK